MAASPPVICQSDNRDLLLIDLPRSIEYAQSSPFQLRSTPALAEPYPSTEPRGKKLAKVHETIHHDHSRQNSNIQQAVASALVKVTSHLESASLSWCYARLSESPQASAQVQVKSQIYPGRLDPFWVERKVAKQLDPPIVLSSTESHNVFRKMADLEDTAVCNPGFRTCIEVGGTIYLIPPKSTFVLSSIVRAQSFFNALTGDFDLILMDPPWPNRSVRRSRKYSTDEHQPQSVFLSTLPILETHLKPQGMVAIWVSNKQAVEDLVLGALQSLNLHQQQEWVWVKVTSKGEPVTALNGIWRKPYEKLMIFGHATRPLSRRIIVAVPDLHSRKPSLKTLFDHFLPNDYKALELFARSLTAGWWSLGDQVLHFQDASEWSSTPSLDL